MLDLVNPDAPYALASSEERQRRAVLLAEPHMKPLVEYRERVRAAMGDSYEMPSFDPCDGGIQARVLLLLEAPGPKAVGSAFISRNNPDPTARNLCELLADAGISRADTILWNIVPWYVGDGAGRIRAVTSQDIAQALPHLDGLLSLLPALEMIVLLGQKAQSAAADIGKRTHVPLVNMPHPSARVFNVWPDKRVEAAETLALIAQRLGNAT